MDKNIDLLAVMELAYRHLNGGTDSLSTKEFVAAHAGMKEARSAVAELIEAVAEFRRSAGPMNRIYVLRVDAALARVKGA